jgi:hypothetical protein
MEKMFKILKYEYMLEENSIFKTWHKISAQETFAQMIALGSTKG